MPIAYNITPEEEAKSNEFGDKLASEVLGLKIDHDASPDSHGRTRWILPGGNKTGFGLLLTLERFFEEQIATIDGEPMPETRDSAL